MKEELLKQKDRIIYEDDVAIALLVKKATARGHIRILPKKLTKSIEDLKEDESEHLFRLANSVAVMLFENLGAKGTNIITNEDDGFMIDIIARNENDGLNFQWQPKQIDTEELASVKSSISSNMVFPDKELEITKNPPVMPDQKEDHIAVSEDNYLIKHLGRRP